MYIYMFIHISLTPYLSLMAFYNMTVWIWGGNDNIFSLAVGLIKLHMLGVSDELKRPDLRGLMSHIKRCSASHDDGTIPNVKGHRVA